MRARTPIPKPKDLKPAWHLVDAKGKILGRLAARLATILQGKHRATYVPHLDTGDFVIVVNVEKMAFTGKKEENRIFHWHTGYPGGLKSISLGELMAKKPGEVLRTAVRRMLPKTTLGRKMLKKLKVYVGPEHPHGAQQPRLLDQKLRLKIGRKK